MIAAIHNHSFGDLLRSLAIAPASGRNHPLKAAREGIEFRKKDRAERAADLHLPLDETRVH